MSLVKKYSRVFDEKQSPLCVGLDPALPGQRNKNTIPEYEGDEGEAVLSFMRRIIREVQDSCMAVKINTQYVLFNLGWRQLKKLNQFIHERGLISILDHKLGDIGSSNESAIHWIKKAGFDAFTYTPYAGNIHETIENASSKGLSVFTLSLMSNPQAQWIQKESMYGKTPLFLQVADIVSSSGGEGMVVGATGNVSTEDLELLRETTGEDMVYLFPGIGVQGGSLEKILSMDGNVLVNVGRDIIYSRDPGQKAEQYSKKIREVRSKNNP